MKIFCNLRKSLILFPNLSQLQKKLKNFEFLCIHSLLENLESFIAVDNELGKFQNFAMQSKRRKEPRMPYIHSLLEQLQSSCKAIQATKQL